MNPFYQPPYAFVVRPLCLILILECVSCSLGVLFETPLLLVYQDGKPFFVGFCNNNYYDPYEFIRLPTKGYRKSNSFEKCHIFMINYSYDI